MESRGVPTSQLLILEKAMMGWPYKNVQAGSE
jgi:hypothetical protein